MRLQVTSYLRRNIKTLSKPKISSCTTQLSLKWEQNKLKSSLIFRILYSYNKFVSRREWRDVFEYFSEPECGILSRNDLHLQIVYCLPVSLAPADTWLLAFEFTLVERTECPSFFQPFNGCEYLFSIWLNNHGAKVTQKPRKQIMNSIVNKY